MKTKRSGMEERLGDLENLARAYEKVRFDAIYYLFGLNGHILPSLFNEYETISHTLEHFVNIK